MTPAQRPAAVAWARVRWATGHPDIEVREFAESTRTAQEAAAAIGWAAAGTPHHVFAIAPVDLIERARASAAAVAT